MTEIYIDEHTVDNVLAAIDKQHERAEQKPEPYPNPSGIHPTEFKVLIEPKVASDKIGSIIIADVTVEKQKYATTEGRIVAVSHLAFSYATEREWDGKKPAPGNRVIFAKYAGLRVEAKDTRDGKDYLLVNDKDIVATLEE